jgi:uncharacterized membrane protein HdeD (DUF308 family)
MDGEMTMTRFAASMALLRGGLLLAAGLAALFAPVPVLTVLVLLGGGLLVADGVLGLASLDYSGKRGWPFWLAIIRSVLVIVLGLAILFSPSLATVFTLSVLTVVLGIQAVVIGLIEVILTVRDRHAYPSIWPVLLAAILYIAFGVLLIVVPFGAATVLTQLGGGLVVVFALAHLTTTWQAIRALGVIQPLR